MLDFVFLVLVGKFKWLVRSTRVFLYTKAIHSGLAFIWVAIYFLKVEDEQG
jgi:hypothetical protein